MAVYNGEKYIKEAIQSILNQSIKNFEFIIIDDGSTDRSLEIIRSFQDPRIIILINDKNRGLAASLNYGISYSRGEYIARMDCDDLSHPLRFAKQINYLEKNPDISVVGSNCTIINEEGKLFGKLTFSTKPIIILWLMHFRNQLAHPSVMVRRSFFSLFQYDEKCIASQDYELWARASGKMKYSNLPQCLLFYRIHSSQMWKLSCIHSAAGEQNSQRAIKILHSRTIDKDIEYDILYNVLQPSGISLNSDFQKTIKYLNYLYSCFLKKNQINMMEKWIIGGETTSLIINCAIRCYKISIIKRISAILMVIFRFPTYPLFILQKKIFEFHYKCPFCLRR